MNEKTKITILPAPIDTYCVICIKDKKDNKKHLLIERVWAFHCESEFNIHGEAGTIIVPISGNNMECSFLEDNKERTIFIGAKNECQNYVNDESRRK